jgi:hypothetical protein
MIQAQKFSSVKNEWIQTLFMDYYYVLFYMKRVDQKERESWFNLWTFLQSKSSGPEQAAGPDWVVCGGVGSLLEVSEVKGAHYRGSRDGVDCSTAEPRWTSPFRLIHSAPPGQFNRVYEPIWKCGDSVHLRDNAAYSRVSLTWRRLSTGI